MKKMFLGLFLVTLSSGSFAYAEDLASSSLSLLLSQSGSIRVVDDKGTDLGTLAEMLLESIGSLAESLNISNHCAAPRSLEVIECTLTLSYSHFLIGDQTTLIDYTVLIQSGGSISIKPVAKLRPH